MPGLYLAGTCVAIVLAAVDEPPILGEPPIAGSSDGTGPTTGDATTGTGGATGSTSTGTGTDTGTATGTTTSVGTSGTSTGDDSSGSDGTATNDDATASATATTTTPGTDSGGSFVEGDITGISYGYEDFENGGCDDLDDPDDADPGCCDSEQNNSDNFCHISRHGRDRVAIAVMLVLLARPRRKQR